jgi:5'-3' exonuclease
MSLNQKHSKDNKPSVALIDADIFVYRVGFASEDVEEKFCLARVTELIHEIVYTDLQCDDYKAYITGKGNFRNEIAVTEPYKGNRKDAKRPVHYEAIRHHLQRLGAELVEGQEADDAVAIEASTNGGWIVSIDKDLDQVAGWHYNFVKKEEYYVTEEQGLRSFYTQILTGDRIDNVIGLKGIGPVKAAKILAECKTEQELYDACLKAYDGDVERVTENGRLLWLRRSPQQVWFPPALNSQDSSGQSDSQKS